jgi:hypothetical protein
MRVKIAQRNFLRGNIPAFVTNPTKSVSGEAGEPKGAARVFPNARHMVRMVELSEEHSE